MNKYLNIVSLNVPYPPNYGGVIDIYYKIKALKAVGVNATVVAEFAVDRQFQHFDLGGSVACCRDGDRVA